MVEKRVYTPKEVALILALSSKTIHRMIASGVIPSITLGSQTLRIPKDKFDRWFQEREKESEREQEQRRNPR